MFEIRPISLESIGRAIEKADRYRLLNEPRQAESICRDVLALLPDNQDALKILVLALTDQFPLRNDVRRDDAAEVVLRLDSEFDRSYYGGVIAERWGKHLLDQGYEKDQVLKHLKEAMDLYDHAEQVSPSDNDDAILRWNTCARIIHTEGLVEASTAKLDVEVEHFDDEMPFR